MYSKGSMQLYVLTIHDVFPENYNMAITVRPRMFVPESHDVSKFVDDNSKLIAVFPDTDGLGTVPPFSYEGATPESSTRKVKHEFVST